MIYKWGGEIMKIKVLEFMSNPLKISTFASSRVPSLTWKQTHFGTHFFSLFSSNFPFVQRCHDFGIGIVNDLFA